MCCLQCSEIWAIMKQWHMCRYENVLNVMRWIFDFEVDLTNARINQGLYIKRIPRFVVSFAIKGISKIWVFVKI